MELGAAAKLLYQQATAAKGRTSLCPPDALCYVPILVSASVGVSPGRKLCLICEITSELGDRQ